MEKAYNLNLARRIRAARRPIHIREDDDVDGGGLPDGLIVRQVGAVVANTVFEFEAGTGLMIDLVITFCRPTFAISFFAFQLPWDDRHCRCLPDPLELEPSSKVYRFGGRYSPEFERGQVLNHQADPTRMLTRGQSVKGLLLGISTAPISEEFRTGAQAPALVIIGDQFAREYTAPVELFVSRAEKRTGSRATARTRKPLFDCLDKV